MDSDRTMTRGDGDRTVVARGDVTAVPGPGAVSDVESPDNPGRHETEEERDDRNLVELIQELRVGALGVQVLFGFLLSLPFFAVRFGRLSHPQRAVYLADLLLAALATALLSAPVAYHRLVFRHHRKRQLLRVSNLLAIAGLATVGLAISGSVLLAVSYVAHGAVVAVIAVATLLTFVSLWFVLPMAGRDHPNR
jgi:O-antigen/teichoic acid export membrane protein